MPPRLLLFAALAFAGNDPGLRFKAQELQNSLSFETVTLFEVLPVAAAAMASGDPYARLPDVRFTVPTQAVPSPLSRMSERLAADVLSGMRRAVDSLSAE